MNPEQTTSRYPFTELVAVDIPLRGSLVLTIARDIVICGWIRWKLPLPKAFPYLVICDLVRNWIVSKDELITNASHRLLRWPFVEGSPLLPCGLDNENQR